MSSPLWTAVARTARVLRAPVLCRRTVMTRAIPAYTLRIQSMSLRRQSTATAEAAVETSKAAEAAPVEDEATLFSSLDGKVHENTLRALTQAPFKYANMSTVQAEILPSLPHLVSPRQDGHADARDLLVKARTGTGKTIAFLVPAIEARIKELERISSAPSSGTSTEALRSKQAAVRQYAMQNVGTLIISPTRELASQIAVEAQKLTSHHRGFETSLFVGGVDKHRQLSRFQGGRKDILVATPGRLRDFLQDNRSGVADALKNTKMLILDEADTLLDMGFRTDIEAIMEQLPPKTIRQTLLFSATVSQGIEQIANTHLADNHLFINCVSEDTSPVHEHIPQYHTVVPHAKDQIPHMMRLIFQDQLEHGANSKVVLFLSTTKLTQLTATILHGLARSTFPSQRTDIFELHSKLTMNARTNAANRFRRSTVPSVLVTSDVSARGVDYPGVTRVIQIGLPKTAEQYVHRVGRTGRGGSKIGRGDLVLLPWELEFVRRQFTHLPLKPLSVSDFVTECEALVSPPPSSEEHPESPFKVRARENLNSVEKNVSEFLKAELDSAAVSETMSSMAGFYAGLAGQLRMDVGQIVEALQKWTVDGLGVQRAPYISAQFLQKLGGSRGSGSRGGDRRSSSFSSTFEKKREWRDNDGESAQRRSGGGFMRNGGGYGGSESNGPWGGRSVRKNRWEEQGEERQSTRSWASDASEERTPRPWERRGADSTERKPRREWDSGRERPTGYQGRRTRSYEARNGRSLDYEA